MYSRVSGTGKFHLHDKTWIETRTRGQRLLAENKDWFGQEETDLFMPDASYEKFVAARE
jgi:hypothetical protein